MLDLARRRVLAALAVMLAGLGARRAAALPSPGLSHDEIRAIIEGSKSRPHQPALRGCCIGGMPPPDAKGFPSLFGSMDGEQTSGEEVSPKAVSGAPTDLDMPAALRRRQS